MDSNYGVVNSFVERIKHQFRFKGAEGSALASVAPIAKENSGSEIASSFLRNPIMSVPTVIAALLLVASYPLFSQATQGAAGKSIDPAQFGAKCDGQSNDTIAFDRARDAAGPNAEIYVRSGTCMVQVVLNVKGQTWHILPGAKVMSMPPSTGYGITVTADHVTIDGGGSIDGNIKNTTASCRSSFACGALLVRNASYVTLHDITIQNSSGRNVYAVNTPYLTVSHCRGFNAGFHSFNIQITEPPEDGTDSIRGVQIVDNFVDTTGNVNQDKDSFQIDGLLRDGKTYYYDGLVFSRNISKLGTTGLGDREEFSYIRNSTIANNTIYNGRLAVSINASKSSTVSNNTAYGISETCFEEVGNDSMVWANNTCSNGTGRAFGGGIWEPTGQGSTNVVVNGLNGWGMTGGGISLYYAKDVTIRRASLEVASASFPKYACAFFAYSRGVKLSLQCKGRMVAGPTYGVALHDTQDVSISDSQFNSLQSSAVLIAGDKKAPGGVPWVAAQDNAGSIPSGVMYYARVVAICPSGRTVGQEGSYSTPAGRSNTLRLIWEWSPVPCATSYELWIGGRRGAETGYFAISGNKFTQTRLPEMTGSMPTQPTPMTMGQVRVINNVTSQVRNLLATRYADGAAGGSSIMTNNNIDSTHQAKYPNYLDYTRNSKQ